MVGGRNHTLRGAQLLNSRRAKAVMRQLVSRRGIWVSASEISGMIADEGRYKHGMSAIQISQFLRRMIRVNDEPISQKSKNVNKKHHTFLYRWDGNVE